MLYTLCENAFYVTNSELLIRTILTPCHETHKFTSTCTSTSTRLIPEFLHQKNWQILQLLATVER